LYCYGNKLIKNLKSLKISPKLKNIFFCIFAGVCFSLAFPPFNIYTLLIVGFAFLIYIVNSSTKVKEVFIRTYIVFFTYELISISWLPLSGLRQDADKFLIIGGLFTLIAHSALLSLPLVFYYIIRKNIIRKFSSKKSLILSTFILPFVYVSIEYLYALPEISFPWVTLGNAFTTALNKIQFIELTGVYSISFWAIILSCLLYFIIILLKDKETNQKKNVIILITVFFVIYFLPDVYTIVSRSNSNYANNLKDGKIKIGIIQPNVNPWKKWGAKQNDLVNDYAEQIKSTDTTNPRNDLLLMPETATPFYLLESFYNEKYLTIKNVIDNISTPLLIGTPDLVYYNDSIKAKADSKVNKSTNEKYDTFNSAVLIQPGEEKLAHQKYAKIKLVIASERMPYQETLLFLKDLIRWSVGISSFQIGWDTTIFKLKNTNFNTAICYESIYPEFFSKFVNKGAEFCVIITNDGWWGKLFGTYQHNQYAVLRAIENRRWIARCANTGISCFIDQYGNMYDETKINEKAYITSSIGISKEKTFYTLHPYLFPNIMLIISGIIVFAAITFRFKK